MGSIKEEEGIDMATLAPITRESIAKRDWLTLIARHPGASKEELWSKMEEAGHRPDAIGAAFRELLAEHRIDE
jgi:hypothetical protein